MVLLIVGRALPVLHNVPHNPLQDLAHTRVDAIVFALVVMIAGGLREEVQRGFVLRRFEQYLGAAQPASSSSARSSAWDTWSRATTWRSRQRFLAPSGVRST